MKNDIKILQILNTFLRERKYIKQSRMIQGLIKQAQSTYTIKSGDTIGKIGEGDPQYIQDILNANPRIKPSNLQVGQIITLPPPPYRPNERLSPSSNILNFIKKHEGGFKSTPYQDHNHNWTVGYGHKITSGEVLKFRAAPMTKAVGENIFMKDIEEAASFIRRNITTPLNQNQFDSLVSIIFNMGSGNFFKSKIYYVLEKEKNLEKTKLLISSLVSDADQNSGITKRRSEEAQIFSLSGK